jgi:hypothetical protein
LRSEDKVLGVTRPGQHRSSTRITPALAMVPTSAFSAQMQPFRLGRISVAQPQRVAR